MKRILRGWFTGPDNQEYEAGRFLWFISVLAGLVYTGAHLAANHEFNIIEFGTGMGALIGLGGAGIAVKDRGGLGVPTATATVAGDLNLDTGDSK